MEKSWWIGSEQEFEARKGEAQSRMKREIPTPSIQSLLDQIIKEELRENMGLATPRTAPHPRAHRVRPEAPSSTLSPSTSTSTTRNGPDS